MLLETWVKPNGKEVQINSDNHKAAADLGWKPKEEVKAEVVSTESDMPKRRGRPPKE
jgi:nucleoside-diphosphate-sugar epimerase